MILRALAALLLLCGAAQANLLQQPPPATQQVIPPPQAIEAGMTIPALISDFSKSFDHSCNGIGHPESAGAWQVTTNGIIEQPDCSALTWPYNDNGNTVLKIQATPSNPGRTGISTESEFASFSVNFPMTGYWECTLRETEHVDANCRGPLLRDTRVRARDRHHVWG